MGRVGRKGQIYGWNDDFISHQNTFLFLGECCHLPFVPRVLEIWKFWHFKSFCLIGSGLELGECPLPNLILLPQTFYWTAASTGLTWKLWRPAESIAASRKSPTTCRQQENRVCCRSRVWEVEKFSWDDVAGCVDRVPGNMLACQDPHCGHGAAQHPVTFIMGYKDIRLYSPLSTLPPSSLPSCCRCPHINNWTSCNKA